MERILLTLLLAFSVACQDKGKEVVVIPKEPVEYEPSIRGFYEEWDFAISDLILYVTDAEGNNLLDSQFEGNLFEGTWIECYGPKLLWGPRYLDGSAHLTRFVPPDPYDEIRVEPVSEQDGTVVLKVPELNLAATDFYSEKFTINWGDETETEIKFDYYYEWAWAEGSDPFSPPSASNPTVPVVTKKLWIDGELASDDSLTGTIVK